MLHALVSPSPVNNRNMKTKRILLLSGNYFPEPTGIGKYNGEMMDWLAGQGHECAVVTTYPYYPFWKVQPPYENRSSWYRKENRQTGDHPPIKVYRCPHYIPKKLTGMKRIFSDLSFFISAFFQVFILLFRRKYDHVITVAPPFQLGLLGLLYKWMKGAKFTYHIQDLQIDTAKELGMLKPGLLTRLMFSVECFILKRSDNNSSISDGMIRKIKSKCDKSVLFFPNWVDTTAFYPLTDSNTLRKKFGLSPMDKVVLYSGAIGEKQGLETIIPTARNLQHLPIKFVICGSGPYRAKLEDLVQKFGLRNVQFVALQPRETFNEFLNMADLHLVIQKANATDLVMPSKLTTILAVGGVAIVTAAKNTSLHDIVSKHNMGIVIEPDNQEALTHAIANASKEGNEWISANARDYAENFLTMDKVVSKFFQEILYGRKPVAVVANPAMKVETAVSSR